MSTYGSKKRAVYRRTWKKHHGGLKSLLWNSYASASKRYKNLVCDLNLEGASVLDIGCGFGGIIPYIGARADTFVYTGVDVMPEFVAEAARRYPDYRFITRDYFASPLEGAFDIVLCCGALNTKAGNVGEFRERAIKTMFDHASRAAAFNMSGGVNMKNTRGQLVHYADPMEILEYCLRLSPRVILRQHYNPKDFTIILFK